MWGFVLPPPTKVDLRRLLSATAIGRERAARDDGLLESVEDAPSQRERSTGVIAEDVVASARDQEHRDDPVLTVLRNGGEAAAALSTAAVMGDTLNAALANATPSTAAGTPMVEASAASSANCATASASGDGGVPQRRGVKRHHNGVPVSDTIAARAELIALAETVRAGRASDSQIARLRRVMEEMRSRRSE